MHLSSYLVVDECFLNYRDSVINSGQALQYEHLYMMMGNHEKLNTLRSDQT